MDHLLEMSEVALRKIYFGANQLQGPLQLKDLLQLAHYRESAMVGWREPNYRMSSYLLLQGQYLDQRQGSIRNHRHGGD